MIQTGAQKSRGTDTVISSTVAYNLFKQQRAVNVG